MFPKKRSFFQRITGTGYDEEPEEEFFDEAAEDQSPVLDRTRSISKSSLGKGSIENSNRSSWMDEQGDEGELSLDMYTTPDSIVVRTMVPGVKKEDIDIAISRDNLTIKGKRVEENRVADQDYHCRELYWGSFIRTIALPYEVDIEHAEASERDGMLTLTLPRVDKGRQTKLRIRSM
jgi:HSP20 family molecular chaperone IbpA